MQTLDLVKPGNSVEFGLGVHLDAVVKGDAASVALVLPGAERIREDAAFIDALSESYTVVAPSHPGFGRSPLPAWCNQVSDIADIYLDWLESNGYDDVLVVGLQFGGWVALDMAARRAPRIGRVALIDSFGVKLGGTTDRDFVDIFATARDDLEKLTYADRSFALGSLELAEEDDVLESLRNEEAMATYGWQPYLHDPRLRASIERIDVPTLVVWGSEDGIVSADYGRALAAEIPGASFQTVDGAAHRPQVERPDEVAQLISTFTH